MVDMLGKCMTPFSGWTSDSISLLKKGPARKRQLFLEGFK